MRGRGSHAPPALRITRLRSAVLFLIIATDDDGLEAAITLAVVVEVTVEVEDPGHRVLGVDLEGEVTTDGLDVVVDRVILTGLLADVPVEARERAELDEAPVEHVDVVRRDLAHRHDLELARAEAIEANLPVERVVLDGGAADRVDGGIEDARLVHTHDQHLAVRAGRGDPQVGEYVVDVVDADLGSGAVDRIGLKEGVEATEHRRRAVTHTGLALTLEDRALQQHLLLLHLLGEVREKRVGRMLPGRHVLRALVRLELRLESLRVVELPEATDARSFGVAVVERLGGPDEADERIRRVGAGGRAEA